MKKSCLLLGAACAALLATTGCTTVNTNDGAVPVSPEMVAPRYTPEMQVAPATVSGEATVSCLFGFITWGPNKFADEAFVTNKYSLSFATAAGTAKRGATYNACAAAKADCLLAAKYEIDTNDYFVFKTVKCKVTGFPATVKSVKAVK